MRPAIVHTAGFIKPHGLRVRHVAAVRRIVWAYWLDYFHCFHSPGHMPPAFAPSRAFRFNLAISVANVGTGGRTVLTAYVMLALRLRSFS